MILHVSVIKLVKSEIFQVFDQFIQTLLMHKILRYLLGIQKVFTEFTQDLSNS